MGQDCSVNGEKTLVVISVANVSNALVDEVMVKDASKALNESITTYLRLDEEVLRFYLLNVKPSKDLDSNGVVDAIGEMGLVFPKSVAISEVVVDYTNRINVEDGVFMSAKSD